jgi:hypothetical protein
MGSVVVVVVVGGSVVVVVVGIGLVEVVVGEIPTDEDGEQAVATSASPIAVTRVRRAVCIGEQGTCKSRILGVDTRMWSMA